MTGNKVVGYGLAAIFGGLLGFAVAKKIIWEIQKEEWQKEDDAAYLERVKEHYDTQDEPEVPEAKKEVIVGKPKIGKKPLATKVIDYTAFTKPSKRTPAEEVKARLGEEEVVGEEHVLGEIYIITEDEYAERGGGKRSLTYYEGDDVLVDEDEKPIISYDDEIGPDALLKFGAGSGDPDMVYVRNKATSTDYAICMKHAKFSAMVLGEPEEPAKKEPVRRRSRRLKEVGDEGDDN